MAKKNCRNYRMRTLMGISETSTGNCPLLIHATHTLVFKTPCNDVKHADVERLHLDKNTRRLRTPVGQHACSSDRSTPDNELIKKCVYVRARNFSRTGLSSWKLVTSTMLSRTWAHNCCHMTGCRLQRTKTNYTEKCTLRKFKNVFQK